MSSSSLTGLEAILWRAGRDPSLRMSIGNLVILDAPPDVDELVDRLETAARTEPRLRWRLSDPSRSRMWPGWVDDPEFDARNHVRRYAVPMPGGQRQLLDLMALVDGTEFEPTRSPWDLTVIEGLAEGRAALYLRADHVLTDGIGASRLVKLLRDEAAPDDEPAARPASTRAEQPAYASHRRPGTISLTIDLTAIARPVAAGIGVARSIDPVDTVVRGVQRGVEVVDSVSRQLVVAGGPLSTLTPSGATTNHFETVSVPGRRAAALRHGGSRNVLLVAAIAAGLGDYHEQHASAVAELRMASPMLVRGANPSGNSFAPLRVEVPTDGVHPATHFGVVADRLARARHEPAMHLTGHLSTAINLLPTRALLPAVRAQIGTVDFIATTLSGPRGPGSICGKAIHASFPFGPRAGRLVNVTAFGNGDRLDLGIALDPVAIRHPDSLVECLQAAFARLIDDGDQPGAGD